MAIYNPPAAAIPLALQARKLKAYFPESKYSIGNNMLVWSGYLQPTFLSPDYLIKIVYKRGNSPNVYVVEPKPLIFPEGKTKLEHVYNTEKQHLCLYHRPSKEWKHTMHIADTIIPWTSEWLYHYEIWVATGTWKGGGLH